MLADSLVGAGVGATSLRPGAQAPQMIRQHSTTPLNNPRPDGPMMHRLLPQRLGQPTGWQSPRSTTGSLTVSGRQRGLRPVSTKGTRAMDGIFRDEAR